MNPLYYIILSFVGFPGWNAAHAGEPTDDPCADITIGISHYDGSAELFDTEALTALSDTQRGAYDLFDLVEYATAYGDEALEGQVRGIELDTFSRLGCIPAGHTDVYADGQAITMHAGEVWGHVFIHDPGDVMFADLPRVMEGSITVFVDGREVATLDPGPSIVTEDGDPAIDLVVKSSTEDDAVWDIGDPSGESLALAEGTPVLVETEAGDAVEVGVADRL